MTNILYLIPFILILVLWVKDNINKALYVIVITELTLASSYLFFGTSPRYLFVPYAIILGIIKYIKSPSYKLKLPTLNSIIFITIFGYYLWISIDQVFIHGYSIFDYKFYKYLGQSLMYVSTAFLIQYFITDEEKLKKFINVIIFFCGISAIVGMCQVLLGGVFVDIGKILLKDTQFIHLAKERAHGFRLLSVFFAYDMLMGSFLSIPIWTNIKTKKIFIKNWSLFLIIFGGLIFSLTRSAIVAFFVGILILAILLKKKLITYLLIIVTLSILLISNINYIKKNSESKRIIKGYDRALNDRKPLFSVGLRIIWNEPFGIGNERYEEYVKNNSKNFAYISGWEGATKSGPHNHFLLNIIYFGWIAGFISMLLIVELFAACRRIYRSPSSQYIKVITILTSGFLVAYSIHILVHHAGFFKGDATVWFVIGILLSLNNIVERKNKCHLPKNASYFASQAPHRE